MYDRAIENGVLRGQYLETDYASFSAWCHWDRPAAGVGDCFSAAAIMSADGAFLLGVMASHTFNGGRIYFPCGTPDPGIIVDGKVDLGLSLRRELKEETGLDMTAFDVEPGWIMSVDGALIAQIKLLRSNESANALRERILAYLASEKRPELEDIRIVRGPADFDPAMPGYAITFLTSWFARA
jgi:8-oxo-dGTP pyrophosphatase MutT (NUDIX family)